MSRRPHSSRQALALFSALLERPSEWCHGYDLMQRTGLKSGTLYPLLIRLADGGLLESEWRPPVAPARAQRHAYRLTSKGLSLAHALLPEAGEGSRGPGRAMPA